MIDKIYFAPLEDVTGFRFRNLYNSMFSGVDIFFNPFISAVCREGRHKKREEEDVSPENNRDLKLIPQILTNDPGDFLNTAAWLIDMGYKEINLNLGCPSKDVAAKKRGSGFLSVPDRLDRFFEEVFNGLRAAGHEDISISVKTRTGYRDTGNMGRLIEIFNRYPLSEVTVHPRLGRDFYRGEPDMEAFKRFYEEIRHPLVYNGDIAAVEDINEIGNKYPGVSAVMIGRGLIGNPALAREYKGGEPLNPEEYRLFFRNIYKIYRKELNADKYALDKMKELWGWAKDNPMFRDSHRAIRSLLRAKNPAEYEYAKQMVFRTVISYKSKP